MTKQVVNIGDTGGAMVLKLANNFDELYENATYKTVADMVAATGHSIGDTVRVQNYSATCLSGEITFKAVAVGEGLTYFGEVFENGVGVDWKPIFGNRVNAAAFGAGGGTGDDSARINRAMLYVVFFGISETAIVDVPLDVYLTSPITVVDGAVLHGFRGGPGVGIVEAATQDLSRIVVSSSLTDAAIILTKGSVLKGFTIIRDGTFSAPGKMIDLDDWQGTAITGFDDGMTVRDCVIGGFFRAMDFTEKGIGKHGRILLENIIIDCVNGIRMVASGDLDRIANIHCWPFLKTFGPLDVGGEYRPGVAFEFRDSGSWARFTSCFAFDYHTGFLFDNIAHISMVGCAVDGLDYTYGVRLEGFNTTFFKMVNCDIDGVFDAGVYIDLDTPAGPGTCILLANNGFGKVATGARLIDIRSAPSVSLTNNGFFTGDTAIYIGADMGLHLSVVGNQFVGQTSALIENAGSGYTSNQIKWADDNCVSDAPSTLVINPVDLITTVASAATVSLPVDTKIVKVTGSTGISAFSVGMPHIERAVEFVDGLTVTASTSIKLKDGAASTTYAAGERATFVCAGTAWYEV